MLRPAVACLRYVDFSEIEGNSQHGLQPIACEAQLLKDVGAQAAQVGWDGFLGHHQGGGNCVI